MIRKTTITLLIIYWIIIGIASIGIARADELTAKQETKMKWFQVLTVVDALQTIKIASTGLAEMNPILGVAPEPVTVVTFFVARNILHEITTKKLPEQYRDNWLIGSIVLQAGAVINNLMVLGGL
jgi:hypothetical protein